ncbi:MAG: T9SS type A sorting domain-containing protein [Flavobacteriales bacterium]
MDSINGFGFCVGIPAVYGCLDISSCNYDSNANANQGCLYPGSICDDNNNSTYNDELNTECVCFGIEHVFGCTDNTAINFNFTATANDSSCVYIGDPCNDNNQSTIFEIWQIVDGALICSGVPVVFGCMDVLADNYSADANTDDGSCLFVPLIYVYHDNVIVNSALDAGEVGLSNKPVQIVVTHEDLNSDTLIVYSNADGFVQYSFAATDALEVQLILNDALWNGDETVYSISVIDTLYLPMTLDSAAVSELPDGIAFNSGIYQGYWDDIHCQYGYEGGYYVSNLGSSPIQIHLEMNYDEMPWNPTITGDNDNYLTVSPDSIDADNNTVIWNTTLNVGQVRLLSFHLDGPQDDTTQFGEFTFNYDFEVLNSEGAVVFSSTDSIELGVSCTYLQNDLSANPVGYEEPHYVLAGDTIEYKVRFENVGNTVAENIVVTDALDLTAFDYFSIEPLYASHAVSTSVNTDNNGNGIVRFEFSNINLPGSSDAASSQGFAVFRAVLRNDVTAEYVVYNEANVAFDYGLGSDEFAINTNQTYHTIFDCNSFDGMNGVTSICQGEPLVLTASQNYVEQYSWFIAGSNLGYPENQSAIEVDNLSAGSYEVVLITANPLCEESHLVNVEVLAPPIITNLFGASLPDQVSACYGENAVLFGTSNGDPATVIWSNGIENGVPFVVTEDLIAFVIVTTQFGCSAEDSVYVDMNELPDVTVTQNGTALSVSSGSSWQWYLNGIAIGDNFSTIQADQAGSYTVEVTNEFGCSAVSEPVVILGVDMNGSSGFTVYPNPFSASANIILPTGVYQVNLYDMTGRIVRAYENCSSRVLLERAELSAGQYQLEVNNGSRRMLAKLVIQ